jgi:hypothetical protein
MKNDKKFKEEIIDYIKANDKKYSDEYLNNCSGTALIIIKTEIESRLLFCKKKK